MDNKLVVAGVGAVSLTIGLASGYFLARKMLDKQYNEKMEAEIQRTREYYSVIYKKEEYATPESAAEKILGEEIPEKSPIQDEVTVEKIDYTKFSVKPEDLNHKPLAVDEVADQIREAIKNQTSEPEETNVFEQYSDDKWMENRDSSKPYIISEEEFLANDPEFDQTQLTYFAGDNQLADDNRQDPIPNHSIVGADNLEHFGVGSGDPRLLYIRNEKIKADFEITFSEGYYQHEVLGLDIQDKYLKHSDHRVRKNRPVWDE